MVARARQRVDLRRRALRARHRAAPPRAGDDGRVRRRRPLPDADAAGGARRPRPAGLRPLRGLRRPALRRAARPRARARGRAAAALAPDRARDQEDVAGRERGDAQDPARTCAPRRAARSPGSATAAGTRSCRPGGARAGSTATSSARRRRPSRHGGCRWRGSRRCRRGARASWCPTSRAASPSALGTPVRRGDRARGGRPAAARDGRTRPSRSRNVRGAVRRDEPTSRPARACSSTTSASAAGRWRCSPASCAAAVRPLSTRWR